MRRLAESRYRLLILPACAFAASVAAAYLWAVLFGDGPHGLKTNGALDRANSYPDADAALLAALAIYTASSLIGLATTSTSMPGSPGLAIARWLLPTALLGLAIFVVVRALT